VDQWKLGRDPEPHILSKIQEAASECYINTAVSKENLNFVKQQLLYYHVIEKRKSQLDAIKHGFQCSPASNFLKLRTYLTTNAFPKMSCAHIPTRLVLEKLKITGDNNEWLDTLMTAFIVEAGTGTRLFP